MSASGMGCATRHFQTGDCGYPGMMVEKDRILLSYYSQHDVDQAPKSKPGEIANDIYLAEVVV